MAVQLGRSEQRGEAYSVPYVEPLSDARTTLAAFFSILSDITLYVYMQTDASMLPMLNLRLRTVHLNAQPSSPDSWSRPTTLMNTAAFRILQQPVHRISK